MRKLTRENLSHVVDWEKTGINIRSRLLGSAWAKDFSSAFNLCGRRVEEKIKHGPLSYEELAILADYLYCNVDDLVVFVGDKFVSDENLAYNRREFVADSTSEEVLESINSATKFIHESEIRNLYEFLLYLPFMPIDALEDIAHRTADNFDMDTYIIRLLNALYRRIPDSPAKRYADSYRDSVLRVKGQGKYNFNYDSAELDAYAEFCVLNIPRLARSDNK